MASEFQACVQVASSGWRSKVNNRNITTSWKITHSLSYLKPSPTLLTFASYLCLQKERKGINLTRWVQWEGRLEETGFCFTLLSDDAKSNTTLLEIRWSLQDNAEDESIQLRPLMLVRGQARRTHWWAWEEAAWAGGGEPTDSGISEAREMSVSWLFRVLALRSTIRANSLRWFTL